MGRWRVQPVGHRSILSTDFFISTVARLTSIKYDRMIAACILREDQGLELIHGEIRELSPIGPQQDVVDFVQRLDLRRHLGGHRSDRFEFEEKKSRTLRRKSKIIGS